MKVVSAIVEGGGGGSVNSTDCDANGNRCNGENLQMEKTTEIQDLLRTHDGLDKSER